MSYQIEKLRLAAGVFAALGLSGALGCAQVVVTRDAKGNNVSVKVEPLLGSPTNNGTAPKTAVQSQSIAQMELAIHNRINAQRKKFGLEPLKFDKALSKVARDYSRQMDKEKFFSHYDAKGRSVSDRVEAADLKYWAVGENLYKSYNVPNVIDAAVNGWMKSKGHRENILRKTYTETGIGIWKRGETYHITQVFLRPR